MVTIGDLESRGLDRPQSGYSEAYKSGFVTFLGQQVLLMARPTILLLGLGFVVSVFC